MKVNSKQSTLLIGSGGKILIDSTNKNSRDAELSGSKKRKLVDENSRPNKLRCKNEVYANVSNFSPKVGKLVDAAIQTDLESSATDLKKIIQMVVKPREVKSPEYWQNLAEERKSAIDITLAENKVLNTENKMLEKDNEELREIYESTKELVQLLEKSADEETTSE